MFIFKATKEINGVAKNVYIMGTNHLGTHVTANVVANALDILKPEVIAVEMAVGSGRFLEADNQEAVGVIAALKSAMPNLRSGNGCECTIEKYAEDTETSILSIEDWDIQSKAMALGSNVVIPPNFADLTRRLITACESGDMDTVMELSAMDAMSDSAESRHYNTFRNMGMAQKVMELLLDNRSNPLVAVGFAHLIGESNVLEILSNLGVRVTRVC